MASYNPPTEIITSFNTSLFNQPEVNLTKSDADLLYLSKKNTDTSTSPLTAFNGQINLNGTTNIGVSGGASNVNFKNSLVMYDTASPYSSFSKIYSSGADLVFESPTGTNTSQRFSIYNAGSVLTTAFELTAFQNISRLILTLTNRLNFSSSSSYSFPFSSTHLGYYLKQTGSAITSLVSNTYTSILTTPTQLDKGVWRIDWSVQNTIITGGTITAEHTLVSTTSANTNTPVSFTGSQSKNHTSQNYSVGDIQMINGSFTLNLTASTTLYLTISRTFSSGSYSFIGEIGATRIA